MTLSARNRFFKGGIILATLSLCIIAVGGYFTFSVFPRIEAYSAQRSWGMIQSFIAASAEPSAYVPLFTMIGAAAYSLISIILIYYFFEKTQSPEILFVALFVISLAFEVTRIIIPLKNVFPISGMYLVAVYRILFFGRYFGLFSLFAASVYSAGLDAQRQQNIFLVLFLVALIIALNIPIDSLLWDSTFMLLSGYKIMFYMVETGILVILVLTFFISAHTRGSRIYVWIGLGAFLALAGRNLLISSDTWITLAPGLAILIAGTLLVCSGLHKVYLWF